MVVGTIFGMFNRRFVYLIDAVNQPDADLSSYDMIGLASGIYFSKFHQLILEFAEKNLPFHTEHRQRWDASLRYHDG